MSYININSNYRHHPVSFDPQAKTDNESARAEALRRYAIYNTPSEEIFSAFTELAARILHAPIGLMSFVEQDEVFYKQSYGLSRTGERVPRQNSPCSLAILSNEVSQFRYAMANPCILADEKLLAGEGYKFYAGAPIITPDGYAIGILAVVDKQVRLYTEDELDALKQLARETMAEIEYRVTFFRNPNLQEFNLRIQALHQRVAALRA